MLPTVDQNQEFIRANSKGFGNGNWTLFSFKKQLVCSRRGFRKLEIPNGKTPSLFCVLCERQFIVATARGDWSKFEKSMRPATFLEHLYTTQAVYKATKMNWELTKRISWSMRLWWETIATWFVCIWYIERPSIIALSTSKRQQVQVMFITVWTQCGSHSCVVSPPRKRSPPNVLNSPESVGLWFVILSIRSAIHPMISHFD